VTRGPTKEQLAKARQRALRVLRAGGLIKALTAGGFKRHGRAHPHRRNAAAQNEKREAHTALLVYELQLSADEKAAALQQYVKRARFDRIAWLVCGTLAAKQLKGGLREPLAGWAVRALTGRCPEPRPKRTSKHKLERWVIEMAVKAALNVDGLRAGRSTASKHKASACDVVANALHELGIPTDYGKVKQIWDKSRAGGSR